ncbi:hypothetical protein [Pseudogemmobacter faecipullorum]|uniref:Uncharacterized protein n=1 Tax=Pseudogemmobacter faecipullorum TaxID=2755041 RepID=A0ABS8CRG9_9RHOB|nr:hypothetical protein [Pseudogemmobacter faecipullorum]MCB5411763.1 hypothetical protein [Pseudogemmobacter faecipullorum]
MKKTATYNPDTQTFTLTGSQWSNTYPVAEFEHWLAFYRRMRDEHPKAGSNYDGWIEALERLQAEMGR